MLILFNEYKNSGKIYEALLVGRNLFNRNPGNAEVFSAYFSYLCMLAETLPSLLDRHNFAKQAGVALAFFEENASLTKESVESLKNFRHRLDDIFRTLEEERLKKEANEREAAASRNTERLKELYTYKNLLRQVSSQEEFDKVLSQIGSLDNEINKDIFTDEQNKAYASLSKEHTKLIGEKMQELEHSRNVDYNKRAAEAFKSAFDEFCKDRSKYANHAQLLKIASSKLFAYDASRLFNETLVYYNHVYSYIFSKLDDDGKFALTRYAIECERKQR